MNAQEFFIYKHRTLSTARGEAKAFSYEDMIQFAYDYNRHKDFLKKKSTPFVDIEATIDNIFCAIEIITGISKKQMIVASRNRELVMARHIAIFLIHQELKYSLEKIGDMFARYIDNKKTKRPEFTNLNHSSIIHAIRRIENIVDGFGTPNENSIVKGAIKEYQRINTLTFIVTPFETQELTTSQG